MIKIINEPEFRMKPVLKVDTHNEEENIQLQYKLQRRITFGPFRAWVNHKTTAMIAVVDTSDNLIKYVKHLTKTIYLIDDAEENNR